MRVKLQVIAIPFTFLLLFLFLFNWEYKGCSVLNRLNPSPVFNADSTKVCDCTFGNGVLQGPEVSASPELQLTLESRLHNSIGEQEIRAETTTTIPLATPPPIRLPEQKLVPSLIPLNSEFGSREWRKYYPELDEHLSKVESGNVKWPVDIRLSTSPSKSQLVIKDTEHLHLGNMFEALIVARDYNGNNKTYGGDYFISRLMRILPDNKPNQDGIACKIEDHGNGTYTVSAPLLWTGRSSLIVHLVHPSEGITQLVHNTSRYVGAGVIHQATFPSGIKTQCDVLLPASGLNSTRICNFSQLTKGISWFCIQPENESCPEEVKWTETIYNWAAEDHLIMNTGDPLFLTNVSWNVPIRGSGMQLVVSGDTGDGVGKISKDMPTCQSYSGMLAVREQSRIPSGLFLDGRWRSLHCANYDTDMARVKRCFQHKVVYLIGDSTMRQWYHSLTQSAELVTKSENTTVVWQQPRTGTNLAYNITVYYRGHSNPVHNPGPPRSSPFITDTIDGISGEGGENIFIFLNVGLHFNLYDPSVLLQRLTAIKNSLIALLRRMPKATIVIRGTNVHEETKITCPSHWFSYRFHRILQSYFTDMPNVGFHETWAMTVVRPQKEVHPDGNMISQQIALMLSYVCGPL